MGRLIIVANRLPISIAKQEDGFHIQESPGGLASGLAALPDSLKRLWLGWPGIPSDQLGPQEKEHIRRELSGRDWIPVFLSQPLIDDYYLGFCNETIWPLFHYFPTRTVFEPRFWNAYQQVNRHFCHELVNRIQPGDSVWIHDFQLMLLPQMLREKAPDLSIGYFLHTPWPSFELFRLLPWRGEILHGLLGADLIGFHTYDYVRHFLSSVARIAGLEHAQSEVNLHTRLARVDAFPLGIDFDKYAGAIREQRVGARVDQIRQEVGQRRIIVSIDRLDYTKGIVERLEAFDWLLSTHPQHKGRVILMIVAVPSRTKIADYRRLRERLEQRVGRINGEHGTMGYVPVRYLYRSLPFAELTALYRVADVALVTPLRDGMNLIAKEFVATRTDGRGVLILSETAGAAGELGEALMVNAYDKMAVAAAMETALEMPAAEQRERNRIMQERLRRYDVARWSADFLHSLAQVKAKQQRLSVRRLSPEDRRQLRTAYADSRTRLLLLDYDGTLVSFRGDPAKAPPDAEILGLLQNLAGDERNRVVVISGRDKDTLEDWLGKLNVALVAEHGGWIREAGQPWRSSQPPTDDWRQTVRPLLELYSDRTPGAFVEEKEFSLVWHYRRAEPALAAVRTQELRDALIDLTQALDVGVFEGNKILEIRRQGIDKGRAVQSLMAEQDREFILAIGDDYTDEDMFAVLPEDACSIRVGLTLSKARFNIDTVQDVRVLLKELPARRGKSDFPLAQGRAATDGGIDMQ
jgi:trehalose 6-phosphate synthase/phosphatase